MALDTDRTDVTGDEELFRRLYPELRRFAAVVGSCETDPDDLVQEAVVKTLRRGSLTRLDSPGGYLRRAIYTLAADSRRETARRRNAVALLARDQETNATGSPELTELEGIGPLDRAILYLVDIEGYKLSEVAPLVGLSHVATRSRASRARHRLRQVIQSEEGNSPWLPLTRLSPALLVILTRSLCSREQDVALREELTRCGRRLAKLPEAGAAG